MSMRSPTRRSTKAWSVNPPVSTQRSAAARIGDRMLIEQQHTERVVGHRVLGIELERAADLDLGLGEPLVFKQRDTQAVAGKAAVGIARDHAAIGGNRLVRIAAHVMGNAE